MTDGNGTNMYMPVAPAYGGGMGGGFGDGNSGAWWLLILLIALGGWGNGGWGNGGNGGGGGMYPWLVNGQMQGYSDVQRGFDQNAVITGITGVQNAVTSGFSDVQTALCNGFAGVQNGFAQAEIANNARQMADMNQMFGLQSALQSCCCENRAATADLKYTMAESVRDVMENCNRNNQAVLDKLCALELDGVKNQLAQAQRENVGLQNQLNMAALRESQTAQNAFIQQGLTNEVDALYSRLSNCPVPCVPVYGSQPVFTCNQGGCGGNFAA